METEQTLWDFAPFLFASVFSNRRLALIKRALGNLKRRFSTAKRRFIFPKRRFAKSFWALARAKREIKSSKRQLGLVIAHFGSCFAINASPKWQQAIAF